ncbi:MAG: hypothetical protein ACI8W1_001800 [Candidatus Azotimanducaceae bacterium]|jgi:hypothetical protein
MRGHFVQFSIATLITLLLTACGGGGGGGDSGILGSSGAASSTPVVTATLTLTILDASGNSTSQVGGNVPVTLQAVLLGSDGSALEGRVVSFESAVGQISPSSGTDLTDENGVAQVQLGAGQVATAGAVSASSSVSGVTVSSPPDINIQSDGLATTVDTGDGTIDPPPIITLTVLDVDGNVTNQVRGNTPISARVLLTTATGVPIVGEVVSFSTAVGQLTPVTGTDLTDTNGTASVQLGAGQTANAGLLTAMAQVNGVAVSASTNVQSDGLATTGGANNLNIVLDLTLTDSTPGVPSSIVTSIDGASANLIIIDRVSTVFNGDVDTPIPNIEANITTSLGTISLANGVPSTVLTTVSDTDGAINFNLAAGIILGSGEITVRVRDIEEVVPFEVGVAGLKIGTGTGVAFVQGDLDIGVNPLSAGGTSVVTVTVVDANNAIVPGISIAFASTCTATIDGDGGFLSTISATSTSNALGIAQATYEATGCTGNDIITATEAISGETASSNILVFAPAVGNIVFRSVTDASGNNIESIFFAESGGISTAEVTFQVLDTRGDPVEGQLVTFSLSTSVGGIKLEDVSGTTDPMGNASAVVNAGFVQTPLTVTATIMFDGDNNDATPLETRNSQSNLLSINSGVADFNSFTLSPSQVAFEAADRTGGTVTLSVFLADKFNNPVPDGTTVNFRTEFGRVSPTCNTVGGDCTAVLDGVNPITPFTGSHQRLDTSSCPSSIIFEEVVSTASGSTQFLARNVLRVEKNTAPASGTEDQLLVLTSDYTVNGDESGITCASANCSGETSLKVTYSRYPDEDNSGTTSHIITNPGLATAPFRSFSSQAGPVPCRTEAIAQGGSVSSGYSGGLGQLYGIRSTILAFASGEESFADVNGNGVYDFGEVFIDLTEAFVDYNEDNVFSTGAAVVADSRDTLVRGCYGPRSPITNPDEVLGNCFQFGVPEEPVDFNGSLSFQKGNGIYNGSSCPRFVDERDEPAEFCDNSSGSPCSEGTSRYCSREPLNISRSLVIGFAGSSPVFGLTDIRSGELVSSVELTRVAGTSRTLKALADVESNDGNTIVAGTAFTIGYADGEVAPHIGDATNLISFGTVGAVNMNISDIFNGLLPSDATIDVAAADDGCLIGSADSGQIGNSRDVTIFLTPDPTLLSGSSLVTVNVTMPSGLVTARSFACSF